MLMMFMVGALLLLGGCVSNQETDLVINAPESSYPGVEVTLSTNVEYGQLKWEVDGKTREGPIYEIDVVIDSFPCEVKVTWISDRVPQIATHTIYLYNESPVIGDLELICVTNKSIIVPGTRYIVTTPNVYDPEGGPVRIVDVTVWSTSWGRENTVFCPPYIGLNPPKPDVYHAIDPRTGKLIENAFVFYSMWDSPLGPGNMPWIPIGWDNNGGYLGCWTECCEQYWPEEIVNPGETWITITVADELDALTTETYVYPTSNYVPCNMRTCVEPL